MPQKNDYVNYSTYGICKIEDICFMKFDSSPKGRNYYILKPVHQNQATIFVPVDNQKQVDCMRPVLSPKEVDNLILSTKVENLLWISDRKQRSAEFQRILYKRDERELLQLISCLYLKAKESEKGLSATDLRILRKAESIIEQEFSFSLKTSTQNIGNYIREKLGLEEINA